MHIRRMTLADIPLGLKLSAQNRWNQREADWRRQLDLEPAGCFLAEHEEVGVGTACACVFGSVAWIALVLVDADVRGRGIGTALMQHVLAWLDARGVASVRLDATPLGRPVYEKLGFAAEFTLHRFAGVLPAEPALRARDHDDVIPASTSDLAEIVALDRRITGTDRARLLERLFAECPEEMRLVRGAAGIEGFVSARPGARAWQIGPCLGSDAACRQLLADASRRHAGRAVFLDVPVDHRAATDLAAALGLEVQRPLLRMGRGPTITEDCTSFWSSYGPEKG